MVWPALVVVTVFAGILASTLLSERFDPERAQIASAFAVQDWGLALVLGTVVGVLVGYVTRHSTWGPAIGLSSWVWLGIFSVITLGWPLVLALFPQETPDGPLTLGEAMWGLLSLSAWSVGVPAAMAVGLLVVKRASYGRVV
jgi:hypothetical protein